MYCPVCRKTMSEVAPALWQCGFCGAGPNSEGFWATWAMFGIERTETGGFTATCIEVAGDDYQIFSVEWDVENGRRTGELRSDPPEIVPKKGSSDYPLPVKVISRTPSALLPGVLTDGLFTESEGPKEVVR